MRLQIELLAAMHHGSGFGIAGLVDRAFLRDHEGMPYLAGSALKGKFRYAAMLVLQANGQRVCRTPGAPQPCQRADPCRVCRIFGSPLKPGGAIFSDAFPAAEFERWFFRTLLETSISPAMAGGSDVRASAGIDRFTRTARDQHLFSTETIRPSTRFEADILGVDAERDLFVQCAKALNSFGADSARGLGLCKYSIAGRGAA